jgi:uncharacterized repeat protein (TIGR03803 family)
MVFAMRLPAAQAQKKFEVIYTFTGNGPDGLNPEGTLLYDEGKTPLIKGTTILGGKWGQGTVFSLNASGKETVLYSFGSNPNGDGIGPIGELVQDKAQNIYGTTEYGGDPSCNCGTVWKLDKSGEETILHAFTEGRDGGLPYGGVIIDKAGNLYGTTFLGGDTACPEGGTSGCGIVFRIDTNGKETVLYRFRGSKNGGFDGAQPYGALVESDGWLYGTTSTGGHFNEGTIFKVHAENGAEIVLYRFDGNEHPGDGCNPLGGLSWDSDVLFGTTSACGASGWGTVFKFVGNTETVLYGFTGKTDGGFPQGKMTPWDGDLYGTTLYGGFISDCPPYGCGTIFKVNTTDGEETLLHGFTDGIDGSFPATGLNVIGDAVFIGTASEGGLGGAGVVFHLSF